MTARMIVETGVTKLDVVGSTFTNFFIFRMLSYGRFSFMSPPAHEVARFLSEFVGYKKRTFNVSPPHLIQLCFRDKLG